VQTFVGGGAARRVHLEVLLASAHAAHDSGRRGARSPADGPGDRPNAAPSIPEGVNDGRTMRRSQDVGDDHAAHGGRRIQRPDRLFGEKHVVGPEIVDDDVFDQTTRVRSKQRSRGRALETQRALQKAGYTQRNARELI
jgi:hypothetical protein